MSKIKKVQDRVSFPEIEEKITKFWKENKIFEKSVEQRPEENIYKFVDGPPFVTGIPHYGSLLPSIAKDIIPRYWTMKGKRVRRIWGWDCHGLPIEEKVSKHLGIKSNDDLVNRVGVEKYIEECRNYVNKSSSDWRWYIDKIGRWVDMEDAYYTMSPEYMESVIWGFKQIYDKGYIYKGKRVSLYSTDASTPVSNFEVAMDSDNYKDVEDLSIFTKFKLTDSKQFEKKYNLNNDNIFLVAWTTTPWTIPSNFALAVNEKAKYCLVEYNGEYLILAKERLSYTFEVSEDLIGKEMGKVVRIVAEFKGSELQGLNYHPIYDFFVSNKTDNDFKVYLSNDVVLDEGTGVLHIAPGFGEVDFNLGKKYELSAEPDIDNEGKMVVGDWKGVYLRDASPLITEDLQNRGNLLRSQLYTHRLPFYRGANPLIYMAQDSYFINVQKIKERMSELNEGINWVPSHIKEGRFKHTIETSPDWAISRNRYWATIMPIWVNTKGEELVVGSMEEMSKYNKDISFKEGKYYFEGKPLDLHKDVCDRIVLTKDGEEYHRIPEVLDCWMDSGSVPFAEYHYPFENKEEFEREISADYIIEYIGQVRAWFNVLLRVSTMIFDDRTFDNVICTGVLAGNDGRKMSKSFGNYPDPKEVLENIGGEALRLYMMSSPIMVGEDMNWSDEQLNEQIKNVLLPVWNTYKYLGIYANLHDWTPKDDKFSSNNLLDIWVKEFMDMMSLEYSKRLEEYHIPSSVKLIQETIDNISSWYIRRSRDRFASGDEEALQTLYHILVQFAKTFAPQMPFVTEEIYQNLVVGVIDAAKESIHLDFYPEVKREINVKLLDDMQMVRKISSLGQNIRVENSIKVRQPLAKVWVPIEDESLREVIKDELNVKEVVFTKEVQNGDGIISQSENQVRSDGYIFISIDTNISEELRQEGFIRELTRQIQNSRKNQNMSIEDKIDLSIYSDNKKVQDVLNKNTEHIAKTVNASGVEVSDSEIEGEKLNIDGVNLTVLLKK